MPPLVAMPKAGAKAKRRPVEHKAWQAGREAARNAQDAGACEARQRAVFSGFVRSLKAFIDGYQAAAADRGEDLFAEGLDFDRGVIGAFVEGFEAGLPRGASSRRSRPSIAGFFNASLAYARDRIDAGEA